MTSGIPLTQGFRGTTRVSQALAPEAIERLNDYGKNKEYLILMKK